MPNPGPPDVCYRQQTDYADRPTALYTPTCVLKTEDNCSYVKIMKKVRTVLGLRLPAVICYPVLSTQPNLSSPLSLQRARAGEIDRDSVLSRGYFWGTVCPTPSISLPLFVFFVLLVVATVHYYASVQRSEPQAGGQQQHQAGVRERRSNSTQRHRLRNSHLRWTFSRYRSDVSAPSVGPQAANGVLQFPTLGTAW